MDVDPVLSVPKPLDTEALHTQLHQMPSSDKPSSSPVIAQPISDAAMLTVDQAQTSPVIAQPVLDAAMEQSDIQQPVPAESTSHWHMPHGHRPMIQYIQKRRHDGSRVMVAGRDTHANVLTEKTRLVEQLDLTTRKIIEKKDQKISELQAQVWIWFRNVDSADNLKIENYRTTMDKFSMRMDELERKVGNESHKPTSGTDRKSVV